MMTYRINENVTQEVRMKMNRGLDLPGKIRIDKAVIYRFNSYPRKLPWKDGTGNYSDTCKFPDWIMIYDSEGNFGQCSCMSVSDLQDYFLPMILSDPEPRTILEWRELFYWRVRANGGYQSSRVGAMASIENMFLDILAKRANQPLHRFLGAEKDWCTIYKGGGSVLRTDEELVQQMLEVKAQGYRHTKIKIGLEDWRRDLRRLELLRKNLGDDFGIAVDANQAWDAEYAMQFVREAKNYNVAWFEEPIHAFDMREIEKFAHMMEDEGIDIDMAYGESACNSFVFYDYAEHGVKHLQPNYRMYTLAETFDVFKYARENGLRVTTGGYMQGCWLPAIMLKEDEPAEYHEPNTWHIENDFAIRSEIKDGKFYLPDIPGMPVLPNFEKLEKDGQLRSIEYLYRKK